jgi:hypothetical protein
MFTVVALCRVPGDRALQAIPAHRAGGIAGVLDDDRAAVEWWTATLEEGRPATLIGTSLLTFTPDALVATGRDCWFLEPGFHRADDGWGR